MRFIHLGKVPFVNMHHSGASVYELFTGTIQKHDALCILALNILNEKIYIFLWFWFIFLSVFSGLALLYSTVIVVLPSIRETILKRRFRFGTPAGVSTVVDKTQVRTWAL